MPDTGADVAKLVDARDLKSLDFGHTGSTPVVRTIEFKLGGSGAPVELSCNSI